MTVHMRVSRLCAVVALGLSMGALGQSGAPFRSSLLAVAQTDRGNAPKQQSRRHGVRIPVDPAQVVVDDGDTVAIRWNTKDRETVRILGIDCPETRHVEQEIPYSQPFGEEARSFALGVFAGATRVEILRAATLDPYDRTLAYVFVGGGVRP